MVIFHSNVKLPEGKICCGNICIVSCRISVELCMYKPNMSRYPDNFKSVGSPSLIGHAFLVGNRHENWSSQESTLYFSPEREIYIHIQGIYIYTYIYICIYIYMCCFFPSDFQVGVTLTHFFKWETENLEEHCLFYLESDD